MKEQAPFGKAAASSKSAASRRRTTGGRIRCTYTADREFAAAGMDAASSRWTGRKHTTSSSIIVYRRDDVLDSRRVRGRTKGAWPHAQQASADAVDMHGAEDVAKGRVLMGGAAGDEGEIRLRSDGHGRSSMRSFLGKEG